MRKTTTQWQNERKFSTLREQEQENIAGSNQGSNESRKRIRGNNGQFIRSQFSNVSHQNYLRQKRYKEKKERVCGQIMDQFLLAFMCRGDIQKDWIPSSTIHSPLAFLLKSVLKSPFIANPRTSKKKMEHMYRHEIMKDVSASSRRMKLKNNATKGEFTRIFVFKGCRVPLLSNDTSEIEPIRKWLSFCEQKNALNVPLPVAYRKCLDVLRSYSYLNGKGTFKNFPDLERNCESHDKELSGAEGLQQPIQQFTTTQSQTRAEYEQAIEEVNNNTNEGGQNGVYNSHSVRTEHSLESNKQALIREASGLQMMASNDKLYLCLCMLFQDDDSSRIIAHVRASSSEFVRQNSPINPLVRDLIEYCVWKANSSANKSSAEVLQFKKMEERLKITVEILTLARRAIGKPLYPELRWKFDNEAFKLNIKIDL